MHLYLVRHGEAAEGPDPGLTAHGQAQVAWSARFLAMTGSMIEHIYHSERARARETATAIGHILKCSDRVAEHPGLQPNDSIIAITEKIYSWTENTILVGHLPFMDLLASYLLAQKDEGFFVFHPGTVVCLSGHHQYWQLEWVLAPVIDATKWG